MNVQPAILIVGPSGSGKTPLGERLAAAGLWGRRCEHFDFGARLRAAAGGDNEAGLSDDQLAVVRGSLKTGELLTDKQFPIAERILRAFLDRQALGPEDLLILNGLPRHVGQAVAVEPIADVGTLVFLNCPPEVAVERIRTNAGGDRDGRKDDNLVLVCARQKVFAAETTPLVEHYGQRGARVELLPVGPDTSAEELRRELEIRIR